MELLYKKIIFDELEKLEITLSESINSDIEEELLQASLI